jgi:hypothetical protein
MTINDSAGYPGTVDDQQWASLIPYAGGSPYGVNALGSLVASVAPNRSIELSPGLMWGWGVLDRVGQAEVVGPFPAPPSGQRFDLLVARRNWQLGATEFAIIQGGSNPVIPPRATRETTDGEVDEQPLWLIRSTPSAVEIFADLRVVPAVSGQAFDTLTMSYLNQVGTRLRIGDYRYERTPGMDGNPSWDQIDEYVSPWIMVAPPRMNELFTWEASRYRFNRGRVEGYIEVRRNSGTPTVSIASNGLLGNGLVSLLGLSGFWTPREEVAIIVRGVTTGVPFFGQMSSGGTVTITHGIPGNQISAGARLRVYFDYPAR